MQIQKGIIIDDNGNSFGLTRKNISCPCGCGFSSVDIELFRCISEICREIKLKYNAERCYAVPHSFCRCLYHNETVQKKYKKHYNPFSSKSQHMYGLAGDSHIEIVMLNGTIKKIDPDEVYNIANKKWPTKYGLGKYPTFTHIDVKPGRARRW